MSTDGKKLAMLNTDNLIYAKCERIYVTSKTQIGSSGAQRARKLAVIVQIPRPGPIGRQ